MAIDAVSGASSTQTSTQNATSRLSADYQSFLKLLTAQLSNQDPLAPMDSSTFVTQLAQLSQVEQAITTNNNLETISSQLANSALLYDMQLIGRTVTVPGNTVALENGAGGFDYQLSTSAQSMKAEILADDGKVIRQFESLPTGAAEMHHVTWDGLDRLGLPVPDGTFTVKLTALDSAGNTIGVTGYSTATVQRLSLETGLSTLHLDNGKTAYSAQVVAVE